MLPRIPELHLFWKILFLEDPVFPEDPMATPRRYQQGICIDPATAGTRGEYDNLERKEPWDS
jgi:hypothetical protein